jgi:hypothetical protein
MSSSLSGLSPPPFAKGGAAGDMGALASLQGSVTYNV